MLGFLKKIKDFILFFPKFFYQKVLKHFLIFIIVFGTPLALSYANIESDAKPTYKVYLALSKLTGTLSENQYYHSSVSGDLQTYLGLIIAYISIMSLYLALLLFMYFAVGGLMAYSAHGSMFKADKKSPFLDPAISSRAQKGLAMLIYAIMVMPSFGATIRLGNGATYQEPLFVFFGKNLLLEVVKRADAIGETDFNNQYDVSDFEVESKLAMHFDFLDYTFKYLKTDFDPATAKPSFNIMETQSFTDDVTGNYSPVTYDVRFGLGDSYGSYTFKSNESLVNKGKQIGVDIRTEERKMIINYFEALNSHASKIATALSETQVTNQGGNTDTDDTYSSEKAESYGQEYHNYCSTIYNKQKPYMTSAEINYYLAVAAMCASESFMDKMYTNKFYNYKEIINNQTDLNRNYTTYYGLERHNLVLNIDTIIKNTQEVCSGDSYLACSAAVSFAASKKALEDYKVGSATSLVRSIAALISINPTDSTTFTSREFNFESRKSSMFEDLSGDITGGSVLHSVDVTPNEVKSYTPELVNGLLDYVRFYAISDIKVPKTTDEIFIAATNLDIGVTFDRLSTCMLHPGEISNGFRCERITREVSRTGLTMVETGMRLWIGSHAMKVVNKTMSKKVKKDQNNNVVISSKSPGKEGMLRKLTKYGSMATVGYMSGTYMAPLFESANYKDGTVLTMLGVQLFGHVVGQDLSDFFKKVGFLLMVKGFFMLIFLLIIPYQFFKAFLMLILMAMTKIFLSPIYLPSIITTKGYDGFIEYFKSVLMTLSGVIICVGLMVTVESYNGILLSFFIKESYEIFNIHMTSWFDLIFNAPLILLMWLIMWLIMTNVFKQNIQENILKELQQFGMN
jgi:hypothetical protein